MSHNHLTSAQLLPDLPPMKPWSISSPVCLRDFKIAGPSSWYVPSPSFSYDISSYTTTSPGYFLNQPPASKTPLITFHCIALCISLILFGLSIYMFISYFFHQNVCRIKSKTVSDYSHHCVY